MRSRLPKSCEVRIILFTQRHEGTKGSEKKRGTKKSIVTLNLVQGLSFQRRSSKTLEQVQGDGWGNG